MSSADAEVVPSRPQERIRVQREWIGAATGTLANPTCWLAALVFVMLPAVSYAYLTGALPAFWAVLCNAVAIYIAFTVMHESMHGVAHANKTVNAWLGRPMGFLLTISAPMFRAVHYEHHSHTNDAERDPDLIVSRSSVWSLPFYALGVTVDYRRHYYGRRLWRDRSELVEAVAVELVTIAIVIAAAVTGNLAVVATLWLAPAMIAVVFLAIAFDYLPHYPYDSTERYLDTRVYPGRAAFVVLLGQNYHLIHHLWTTVPWFRYPVVFKAIRSELERRGSRIGWKVLPLPDVAGTTSAGPVVDLRNVSSTPVT